MIDSFDALPGHARLWIYQADRSLTKSEEERISAELSKFCNEWAAHGNPLRTSYKIDHHQFVLLAVDETAHGASGCSIDDSIRVIKKLQAMLGIDFFNRTNVAFLDSGRVSVYPLATLKTAFAMGKLYPDSLLFNTTLQTVGDYQKSWIIPAEKSWVAKYLPNPALTS